MSKITAETLRKSNVMDLPYKPNSEPQVYSYLLIVPSRRKHDSGWTQIQVVGSKNSGGTELELCTSFSDDLNIYLPSMLTKGYETLRMDCFHPSGILRLWSNHFDFEIGFATSSFSVKLVNKEQTKVSSKEVEQ